MKTLFTKSFATFSALGLVAGLGVGQADAASLYLDEASFIGATGTLSFESFESASGSNVPSINVGDVTASDTTLSIYTNASPGDHYATDGSKYLYRGSSSGDLTLSFDSAINSVGFFLTDLFWTNLGPEVVVTTDTGEVFNTGLTNKTSEAYVGILADNVFNSITIALQDWDGVGLDSLSYGITGGTEQIDNDESQQGPGYDNGLPDNGGAHAVPSPAAGFAGLTLLGLLAARRRRKA